MDEQGDRPQASSRASCWGGLFDDADFRKSLSWKGRFAGIRNAVNFYSTTEDVVGNIDRGKSIMHWPVWPIQESIKGGGAHTRHQRSAGACGV